MEDQYRLVRVDHEQFDVMSSQIMKITEVSGYSQRVGICISNVLAYMFAADWHGACHFISSILYVLLSECDLDVDLCIGNVLDYVHQVRFSHSWLSIGDQAVDLACYFPSHDTDYVNYPVVFDIALIDPFTSIFEYGMPKKYELDDPATKAYAMPFVEFMDQFKLWDVCERISPVDVTAGELREKYKDAKRCMVHTEHIEAE